MIPLALGDEKASATVTGRNYLTLGLCAAAAMLEGFDTQSMGVAAPRLVAEFGLSAAQSGLIFSSTTLGLFVGAAIGGRVADHLGRKRTLIASLMLLGIFSMLLAAAMIMTGQTWEGYGGPLVTRTENPKRFWKNVAVIIFVGLAGIGFFLYQISK